MSYLLLANNHDGGWTIKRAETLEELAKLYRDHWNEPSGLIVAKELPIKLCDPDESKEVEL